MRLVRVLACIGLMSSASFAQAFETLAKSAMLVDQTTGTVLLAKNADQSVPPASMSKLMTLNMLFEALRAGRISLDTKFPVSEKAHNMGGSTMFLRAKERVSVDNLLRGIIVQSGNDACVTVAEALAGSEAEFARQMTARAKELGMTSSIFANSTGWPHPGQRMSARDLVFLANRIITEFPEFYAYFAEKEFTWDNISQKNRNPLLKLGIGADGLKTGHTEEAGYGLVGSAKQGDRRIIFMITGLNSESDRANEAERLTSWAFRQFVKKDLFEKNTRIASAKVWIGKENSVNLVSKEGITTLAPYNKNTPVKLEVNYQSPIAAPISTDKPIATLTVIPDGMEPSKYPLYAEKEVAKGGLLSRMRASAEILSKDVLGGKLFSKE
ncbi:D-alanyl-D-alanine carboxypeptidase [Amylibacter kogurei]|uniref:serine-type D-Ala-D-Ala carboxypeptidase n=1 Tax=Paramylibacter kogurei TaxID=1889778 RepID=A0A2G5K767_9RHOB|nr:D-alanyl-D-alanine carboxypeptidase family protein [Amylibacter kogurei]PIB24544.1 D-alanyl-D-alanine carboxypeptidase [Amylibacter kogurei]